MHTVGRMLRRETQVPAPLWLRLSRATPLGLVMTMLCFLAGIQLSEVAEWPVRERVVIERRVAEAPAVLRCETNDVRSTVVRSAVDQWLAKPDELARSARIVPSFHRPSGFKLYAIRPDSPLAIVGVHNGDILHRINGFELTSPDQALALYTRLRSTDHLTLDLTRAGCPLTITLSIV